MTQRLVAPDVSIPGCHDISLTDRPSTLKLFAVPSTHTTTTPSNHHARQYNAVKFRYARQRDAVNPNAVNPNTVKFIPGPTKPGVQRRQLRLTNAGPRGGDDMEDMRD